MPTEYSLQYIADAADGDAVGEKDKRISGVAPFDTADSNQITFAGGSKFLKRIDDTRAGAIIVPKGFASPGKNLIGVNNPQLAFAKVVALYHPTVLPPSGISEMSSMGDGVQAGDGVFIGAFTTIGNRVTIGSGSIIQNGVFIGDDVAIGDDVVVHPNVTILNGCRIGNRVIIHPGAVIGSDGYGFVPDGGRYHKIPQVGIAGSTKIGHHAIIAGQAGISGHLTIDSHVTMGPMTGVGKSIPDGEVVSSGSPSMPHRAWLRVQRVIPALPEMKKKIADLEKKSPSWKKSLRSAESKQRSTHGNGI